jgi:acyl-CoA thioesterase FadM
MRPGHGYEATLVVAKLGESSFDVLTRFHDLEAQNPVLCAETLVSHVFADPRRLRKIPIPSALRPRLEAHLAGE